MKATIKKGLNVFGIFVIVFMFMYLCGVYISDLLALILSPFVWIIRGEHLMDDLNDIYKSCYQKLTKGK
jgi:hypothetical protein